MLGLLSLTRSLLENTFKNEVFFRKFLVCAVASWQNINIHNGLPASILVFSPEAAALKKTEQKGFLYAVIYEHFFIKERYRQ